MSESDKQKYYTKLNLALFVVAFYIGSYLEWLTSLVEL